MEDNGVKTLTVLAVCFAAFFWGFSVAGCRKQTKSTSPPPPTVQQQQGEQQGENGMEEGEQVIACFPSGEAPTPPPTMGLARGVVQAAQSATISKGSSAALEKLHLSGLALLGIALLARLLFGTWKAAFGAAALGLVPSVGAILLTDFPAVTLLVPIIGVVLLVLYAIRSFADWHTGYKAWKDLSIAVEASDVGAQSMGHKVKDVFEKLGLKPSLDKAVKMMEPTWNAVKPSKKKKNQ
jgi:hypothetical protein